MLDRIDGGFSANAAARGNGSESIGLDIFEGDRFVEANSDRVLRVRGEFAATDFLKIGFGASDAFGDHESGREFFIMSGSPHGDDEGIVADTDFEGFLDCHIVVDRVGASVSVEANNGALNNRRTGWFWFQKWIINTQAGSSGSIV